MTEPLGIRSSVRSPLEQTFELWTARTRSWWPMTHTVSAEPGGEIITEPGVGGRGYERTPRGSEHDWGQITLWDSPTRIAHLWHGE